MRIMTTQLTSKMLFLQAFMLLFASTNTYAKECLELYRAKAMQKADFVYNLTQNTKDLLSSNYVHGVYADTASFYYSFAYIGGMIHWAQGGADGTMLALTAAGVSAQLTTTTVDATDDLLEAQELKAITRLILQSKLGGGPDLQSFTQDLKDEGIIISQIDIAKEIIRMNDNETLCPKQETLLNMGEIKNVLIEDYSRRSAAKILQN